MPRAVPIAFTSLALALGCTPAPRGLAWTIDFQTRALHDQTSVVEATILRGGCTGTLVYRTAARATGTMAMQPPGLPPGVYGFAATAYDATCTAIGDDCQSVTLPGATSVMDLIRAHAGSAACPATMCHAGLCEMDAGMPDAGPRDGGARDADALVCAATETSCTNNIDDDCNGLTDCADPACTSDPACARCTGVICSACHTCDPANGQCRAASDGSTCTGGRCVSGACCTTCTMGSACMPGDTLAACGTGGGACSACGECAACTAGSCAPGRQGSACGGGAGHCAAGSCCTGCITGTGACSGGTAGASCGQGGVACAVCGACQTCSAGRCVSAPDGTTCPTGACLGGVCCNGCFVVGTCQPGNTRMACGPRGGACVSCGECQWCSASGTCVPTADGSACANGTCAGGACCTGCMTGGTCVTGTGAGACGYGGRRCSPCASCSTSAPNGGTCSGIGTSCANSIEPPFGTTVYAIDTCMLTNHFSWGAGACGADLVPPPGTPDVVFSAVTPTGNFQVTTEPGWTVGLLDSSGSCTAPGTSVCASAAYGLSGGPPGRVYIGVQRTAGGCGRVIIAVTHN